MTVGIIGCGNIASIYVQNFWRWAPIELVGVADLLADKAEELGAKHSVPNFSPEALLHDVSPELIVNLTTPDSHFSVAKAALQAGKHVYSEKPLCQTYTEGKELLSIAKENGLRVGCAPDTVLGGGIQRTREMITNGAIGRVTSAQAFMMCPGHESWHPNPSFYYQPGAGPLFDMGPYYLTSLVTLLGPIVRVTGMASKAHDHRRVMSEPLKGQSIDVNTPTHIVAVLEFASGAITQLTTSFDVQRHSMPFAEIYGTEGTLQMPDPNGFGGSPYDLTAQCSVPNNWPYQDNCRGLGVLEMIQSISEERPHRASGDIALHVLEVMESVLDASNTGRTITLRPFFEVPEPMPHDGLPCSSQTP